MVATAALADVGFDFSVAKATVGPELTGEAGLTRAAAGGDRAAFSRLVEFHKRSVYGLCFRILREPEESRDAAQEAFVRAFTSLTTFDSSQPFAPWVLRIAKNHCLDIIRRRATQGRPYELDAQPEGEDAPERRELPDPAAQRGDELLQQRQTARTLQEAVDALPANYREVVTLFHVEQLSYKEIASAMEIPIGTVMTWLHRARGKLRAALAGKEVEP